MIYTWSATRYFNILTNNSKSMRPTPYFTHKFRPGSIVQILLQSALPKSLGMAEVHGSLTPVCWGKLRLRIYESVCSAIHHPVCIVVCSAAKHFGSFSYSLFSRRVAQYLNLFCNIRDTT